MLRSKGRKETNFSQKANNDDIQDCRWQACSKGTIGYPGRLAVNLTAPGLTAHHGQAHSFQGDKDNRFRKRKAGPQRMPEADRRPEVPMPSLTRWGTEALKRTISLMTLNEFSTLLSTCSLSLGLECFESSTWLVSGCKRAPLVCRCGDPPPQNALLLPCSLEEAGGMLERSLIVFPL